MIEQLFTNDSHDAFFSLLITMMQTSAYETISNMN